MSEKTGRATGMTLTWEVLDQHFATDISNLTAAAVPDLSLDEARYWSANYVLNSALRGSYVMPLRRFVFTFLRRAAAAFEEYALARTATLEFVDRRARGEQPTDAYWSALHHWEQCVASAWQAIASIREHSGTDAFTKGDGTPVERLNMTYNRAKHTESAIGAEGQMPPVGPLAMWLTNDGLQTTESLLSWQELHDILEEIGASAERVQDPKSFGSSAP